MDQSEVIADLKQFIVATVSQSVADSEQRIKSEIGGRINNVDTKLDTILDAVGERLEAAETRIQDHEQRIGALQSRAA